MMLILQILIGCLIGFIFGLIPNFHINIISYIFLELSLIFIFPNYFYLFLSLSISQLITSYIPTTIFGVPNPENIMFLFPAQRLFFKGEAKQAIFLSLFGSFFGVVSSIILLPLLFVLFTILGKYNLFIYLIIIFVLILFIIQEKGTKQKLVVFSIMVFAGVLGIFTLKLNYFFKSPLLVCVSGLFAFPMLIKSLFDKPSYVLQKIDTTPIKKNNIFLAFFGALSSLLIILVPSFSSSQAATIVSKIKSNLGSSKYLILFSSISISSLIFSYFLAINFLKPRLGYIAILLLEHQVPIHVNYLLFGLVILVSTSLSILLVYMILDSIIYFVNTHNLNILNLIVLIISFVIVFLVSGFRSIGLLFLSILVGFLPINFNKSRVILIAYIMIPTLLFYI